MTPDEIKEIVPVIEFRYSDDIWKNIKRAKRLLKPTRNIFLRKKYTAFGLCQVTGVEEYKDGYCLPLYHLSLLLKEWEERPLSLFYCRTLAGWP